MKRVTCSTLLLIAVALSIGADGALPLVDAKRKPKDPWKQYPTRTLDELSGFQPKTIPLDEYGGRADRTYRATGFFRTESVNGKPTLIDPLGHAYLTVAVVNVSPNTSDKGKRRAAFERNFGDSSGWARQATAMLRAAGFNSTGCWSDDTVLRQTSQPLAYTPYLGLLANFAKAKNLTHVRPGHAGYVNDSIPVFHPDFPAWCTEKTAALSKLKDDPYLLGYFSDNEFPYPNIQKYLALDPKDPEMGSSYAAARQWWSQRKGEGVDPAAAGATDDDQHAFAQFVYETYYQIVASAIRAVDPNHMYLGSRLHFPDYKKPGAWRASRKLVDVISVNYYGAWTPEPDTMNNWVEWSGGKPFMVTEWYARGDDVGFANTSGAGWIVPTQDDRGKFYENFTLGLLAHPNCVGWHWFKYRDNDPEDTNADPSNRDSNKGLVNLDLKPYPPLLTRMTRLNRQVYALHDFLNR